MVAPASARGVHYAPEDPTLPSPWTALVHGDTGYVYYWNTETNETTYVKPTVVPAPDGAPGFSSVANGSSQQGYQENADGHVSASNGASNGYGGKNIDAKLAALHVFGQQVANGASLNGGSSGVSLQGSFKRSAETGEYNDRDAYKRPRMQVSANLDVESYRRQHEITVQGSDVPPPFTTFDSIGLPPEILRELQAAGFAAPTPIQAQSWPIALRGRDIVAIAKTGSGKTLGYLLPAFLHLENRRSHSRFGPKVLVLAPTRELATQIHEEAMKFGRSSRLTSTCVYGGAPKGPQLRDIERGCDIVIATPGRLNDFLEMRRVNVSQVSYLVLDEADRMLDMGFEPQIRKIVNELPLQRQTLMYTATWPKEVRKIAGDLLVNPVQVNIGNTDDLAANKAITQCVEVVSPHDKSERLQRILRNQDPGSKIIIFCSTKRMCDQLAQGLRRDFAAAAIHGDKSQNERDWVLTQFKNGKSPVLVATDVAARGLDIKDIRVVINYDFPTGVEDYVHRIGRTGRAGATGLAFTFFTEQDGKHAKDLIKVLEGSNQKVPMELRDLAARGFYGKPRNRWDSSAGRNGGAVGSRGPADTYGGGYGNRGNSWAPPRSSSRDNSRGNENGDSYSRGRYGDSRTEQKRSYSRSRSRSPNPRSSRSGHERSRHRSRSPHSRFSDAAAPAYPSATGHGSGWHW